MADKSREQQKAASGHQTVLDPLRPAVVVRRRVTVVENGGMNMPRAFSSEQPMDDEDDENGPPSSVNVARALASLRADELKRVEELLSADDRDEEERTASARAREAEAREVVAAPPPPPTVTVGKSISLSKLADQMGMQAKDLTATLVASGFYSLHAKTVLPRGTARTIAELFGWQVNELPDAAGDEPISEDNDIPDSVAPVTKPKSKKPKSSPTASSHLGGVPPKPPKRKR
jgi:hypothetical protein